MMSGKPVIVAAASINDPVAEAECGMTVPPEDPTKLGDAIVQMCNMTEEERRVMGIRGQEYVMKYHSTPVLAARLLEAMQESGMSDSRDASDPQG